MFTSPKNLVAVAFAIASPLASHGQEPAQINASHIIYIPAIDEYKAGGLLGQNIESVGPAGASIADFTIEQDRATLLIIARKTKLGDFDDFGVLDFSAVKLELDEFRVPDPHLGRVSPLTGPPINWNALIIAEELTALDLLGNIVRAKGSNEPFEVSDLILATDGSIRRVILNEPNNPTTNYIVPFGALSVTADKYRVLLTYDEVVSSPQLAAVFSD